MTELIIIEKESSAVARRPDAGAGRRAVQGLDEMLLEVARRADAMDARCERGRDVDRRLWLRAEQQYFDGRLDGS